MTPDEAFKKFLAAHEHNDLPWEMQEEEMRPTFMAGWHAHAESLKQLPLAGCLEAEPVRGSGGVCGQAAVTPEDIYSAYPRKIGKQAALKAIIKAVKGHMGSERVSVSAGMAEMLRLTRLYAAAVARWPAADKQFIPHPATWFNRGSYEDDPKEWQRGHFTASQFTKARS